MSETMFHTYTEPQAKLQLNSGTLFAYTSLLVI
jgi:hypothetical protein